MVYAAAVLAQTSTSATGTQGDLAAMAIFWVLWLGVMVFYTACIWRIFTKAGYPGWHSIVPFLNLYTLVRVAGRPGWWMLLMLIPCVGTVVGVIVYLELAQQFGKGVGFGLGLVFLSPIFLPILAFGSASYGAGWSGPVRYAPAGPAVPRSPGWTGAPAHPLAPGQPPAGVPGPAASFEPAALRPLPPAPVVPPVAPLVPPPAPPPASAPPPAASGAAPSLPDARPPSIAAPSAAPSAPPSAPTGAPGAPAAGWYDDPSDAGQLRWWSGSGWTEHVRARPPG